MSVFSACSLLVKPNQARRTASNPTKRLIPGGLLVALSLVSPMLSDAHADDKARAGDLAAPEKKEIALKLISAAENSTRDWKSRYKYVEYDVEHADPNGPPEVSGKDKRPTYRGFTAGTMGFCTQTGDLLDVVNKFDEGCRKDGALKGEHPLKKYMNLLQKYKDMKVRTERADMCKFEEDWAKCDEEPYRVHFREAQDYVRDQDKFNPAVDLGKEHGLSTLGQFIYFDAIVMHGRDDFKKLVEQARARSNPRLKFPLEREKEAEYLRAFTNARIAFMINEPDHEDNIDRVVGIQRMFLANENFALDLPLHFDVNGTAHDIPESRDPP